MIQHFEEKLDRYAEITVKIGVNIQKGQTLLISAPLEAVEFVKRVMKHAYDNGCKRVSVRWNDAATQRIHIENAPEETLKEIPEWQIAEMKDLTDNKGAILNITGGDPKAFEGVDPQRLTLTSKTSGNKLHFFQKAQLNGDLHWAIVGVPTKAWAATVFPDKPAEVALDLLWEAVLKTVRVDQEDPVKAWEEHSKTLVAKMDELNAKHFKTLHYKSPVTDLSIDLHPDHIWLGAGHHSTFGTSYIPNMPTEEVFTAPLKQGVNGIVTSTKPLSFMGNMIENFSLTFKDGKVVDFKAEKGYDALKEALSIDEGMKFLGEVALVPYDSPISNSGIIFNNTLYDENASCHIALGSAIGMNIKGAGQLTKEELVEKGVNQSLGHVDFMIGSADLDIDGETYDGERIPLFRKGNWA
ncbi:aminopeptidase [Pullulanibacillus pueri]|uniref:Aminopeptidase n=1 Tax=Pullulanibacillus pueri TaxID=1437324 RepID=A0A8J3ELN8_9BACL|nr:aminopeptidase [Pullulanibacillus pueri]MBM7682391.1 aminopeptidase [Pullulanibacillus pueri]GGH81821.1 aminopeptidase [Pullulanibacillus pueri]